MRAREQRGSEGGHREVRAEEEKREKGKREMGKKGFHACLNYNLPTVTDS